MSKLYEINMELDELMDMCEWDPDRKAYIDTATGEILQEDEYEMRLHSLGYQKQQILEWMARKVLNLRMEAAGRKVEVKRLQTEAQKREKLADRLEEIIARECAGEKTDLGVATMAYRKSEAVVWDEKDAPDIICWLQEHDHDDCLKYAEPEIRKTELKALIKGGVHVPLAMVEQRNNGKLK